MSESTGQDPGQTPQDDPLTKKFKTHIEWEDGMDQSLLSLYLGSARQYVINATGREDDLLIMNVAAIFYDFRVPEADMGKALDALTPFLLSATLGDDGDEATD